MRKYQKARALMIFIHIILMVIALFNTKGIVEYIDFYRGIVLGTLFTLISCEFIDVRAEYEFEETCREIVNEYLN